MKIGRHAVQVAALALGLVLVVGCNRRPRGRAGAAASAPVPAPAAAVESCLTFVRATATRTARCEGGVAWWGSLDRAVEQLRPACEVMARAPGVHYRREQADSCAAALAALPCEAPTPAACQVTGSLAAGAPCGMDEQCGAGLFCDALLGDPCGVCALLPGAGQECEVRCVDGLYCSDFTCAPLRQDGESCLTPFDCARTLQCAPGADGDDICRRFQQAGESCTERLACASGLRCAGTVCVPREPPGQPGAACKDGLDCVDFSCVAGKCAALARLGERCSHVGAHPPCEPSLLCHEDRCIPRDPAACSRPATRR